MPSRGTTKRNIRVPDELWDKAIEETAKEGTNVSAVINEFLRQRFVVHQAREAYVAKLAEESSPVLASLGIANMTRPQKLAALRARLQGIDNPVERFAIEKQIELLEMLG